MLKKYFTEEEYNSLQASNDLLFKTLEFMINNNYRRFYRDISDIINNIDIF